MEQGRIPQVEGAGIDPRRLPEAASSPRDPNPYLCVTSTARSSDKRSPGLSLSVLLPASL